MSGNDYADYVFGESAFCDAASGCLTCTANQFQALQDSGMTEAAVKQLCAVFAGIQAVSAVEANLIAGINTVFITLCAAMVFIMHAGFAMLCAGAIRSKNTMNILLQTVLDAMVSAIAFYLIGWAFAYSAGDSPQPSNPFIGSWGFALSDYSTTGASNSDFNINAYYFNSTGGLTQDTEVLTQVSWESWVFQWAFAATATTIPAGCVAERFNFNAYLGYSFFISAWLYPTIVHWVWGGGWLAYTGFEYSDGSVFRLFDSGFIDFAGSAVVHMTGGFCGMWGAILAGPRMGRFDSNGNPIDMPGHSATLVVLGTCLLWFGWYGFNPGSVLACSNIGAAEVVGRAACCTTLSGAAGGVIGLLSSFVRHKAWDLLAVCNGVLVGFVSITASAHVFEPWAAILAGGIGAVIFDGTCWLWLKLKIDDPLLASPMHGVVGAWACIWTGCMAKEEYVGQSYGISVPYGCFYPGGGGKLLAAQVIGVLVIFAWITVNIVPFFLIFKFLGILRISAEEEQAGLDVSKHGGSAYNNTEEMVADGADKEAPAPI